VVGNQLERDFVDKELQSCSVSVLKVQAKSRHITSHHIRPLPFPPLHTPEWLECHPPLVPPARRLLRRFGTGTGSASPLCLSPAGGLLQASFYELRQTLTANRHSHRTPLAQAQDERILPVPCLLECRSHNSQGTARSPGPISLGLFSPSSHRNCPNPSISPVHRRGAAGDSPHRDTGGSASGVEQISQRQRDWVVGSYQPNGFLGPQWLIEG
jgi:hypothetical protein